MQNTHNKRRYWYHLYGHGLLRDASMLFLNFQQKKDKITLFRKNIRLEILTNLYVLGCPEFNLTVLRKCQRVCLCKTNTDSCN